MLICTGARSSSITDFFTKVIWLYTPIFSSAPVFSFNDKLTQKLTAKIGVILAKGVAIPRYKPNTPSFFMICLKQSNVFLYNPSLVWRRTLTRSNGCLYKCLLYEHRKKTRFIFTYPTSTEAIPPKPPERNDLTEEAVFVLTSAATGLVSAEDIICRKESELKKEE